VRVTPVTCRLTNKNRTPYTACRDKVAPSDFVFRVSTGWRVLRATIEEKFQAALPGQWNLNMDVFLKPSKHAPQKDYVKLSASTDALLLAPSAPPQRLPSKLRPDADRLRTEAGRTSHDVASGN
jgi:hypothetical protein